MSSILLFIAAASVATPTLRLKSATTVALGGRLVRMGDVVSLDSIGAAERARIAPMILARLSATGRRHAMRRSSLARLASLRLPDRTFASDASGEITFVMPATLKSGAANAGCVALVRPVAPGETLTASSTRPVPCRERANAPVAYARSMHRLVATGNMVAATDLGRIRIPEEVAVERGAALRLVSRTGPVRIERAVTALQSSLTGRRIFVRDGEGQVFSVRFDRTGAVR